MSELNEEVESILYICREVSGQIWLDEVLGLC
jgi:hypothetical protein